MTVAMTELATNPELQLEQHRSELTGYCYRMLGSAFEAEDAVQETLLRAWKSLDRFEGRSALRSWLYRIATNVCLDMLEGRARRARPMEIGELVHADVSLPEPVAETTWIEPVPDSLVLPAEADPADVAVARDTIRLAFVAALQHLPPRQRATLILCEVLHWKASEVAELLETSVASVTSSLQRARSTVSSLDINATDVPGELDHDQTELLARYVDAFERYDMDLLVALLHEDATLSMPPYAMWLRGHADIRGWMLGTGFECRGSRLLPVWANGSPAFGQYRPSGPGGRHEPWALQVLELSGGKVAALNAFLDVGRYFPLFGLPERLDS
jgi:RNA polymerase sigma-70 factor (ECF subfamily)